jgi:HD-like signal output (HDOD) protein
MRTLQSLDGYTLLAQEAVMTLLPPKAQAMPITIRRKIVLLDPHGNFTKWSHLLSHNNKEWDLVLLDDPNAFLKRLNEQPTDAIILAYDIKTALKNELARQVKKKQPNTLRFQVGIAAESGRERNLRQALMHRTFEHPTDYTDIFAQIGFLLKVHQILNRPMVQKYLGARKHTKPPAQLAIQLFDAAGSYEPVADALHVVLEKYSPLTQQVMLWVNSKAFVHHSNILGTSDLVKKVDPRKLRGLLILAYIYRVFPMAKSWDAFSFEQVVMRSMVAAQLAEEVAKDANLTSMEQEQSYLSALLMDIGVLMLASLKPDSYRKVLKQAEDQKQSLHTAEKQLLGVFHGELGAALLNHWLIPARVTESVFFHATPNLSNDQKMTPLTAAHVADALLPSCWVGKTHEGEDAPAAQMRSSLSKSYLERIKHASSYHRWALLAPKYRAMLRA